jgi:thiol-disulfide isomerase/thioredoxin
MKIVKKFLSVLLFLIIIGCNGQDIVITVEFPEQPEVNALIYSVPISGTIYLGFSDTLKRNEMGKFELKMKIAQSSFITFWSETSPRDRHKLLIEQGNNYHISIENQQNVQIKGANEKGQMLYATLPNPAFIEMELRNWLRDTTVTINNIHHQISELKQSDLSKFKELLNEKEITKSFFELVQKDRDCYYASLETRYLLIKSFEPVRRGEKIDDELLENLKKIYDQYSPNDERFLFSSFWSEYATNYVENYKQFVQENFSVQKFQELAQSGAIYTHYSDEAKKYLSGKALELYQARHIHFTCIQPRSSFEKSLISLFEQFEKDYPRSEYAKYLKPYIDKVIEHHQIIEQSFDQATLFMDKYETINTLEEAIKSLQGKKIYIDVWATWCGPCIEEFKHNEALKKILTENNIQQLYISIDRDEDDQKWKNAIKQYRLTGTHIRTNKDFQSYLSKLYSAENPHLAIPWYMLIDENGNIMEERAKRPSQLVAGEKLW